MIPRPRLQEEFAYHAPELKKVVSPAEKFLQGMLVAVVGTGLGIGVGVFLAGRTGPANASAATDPTPVVVTASQLATATTQARAETVPAASADGIARTEIDAPDTKQTAVVKPTLVTELAASANVYQPKLVSASLTGIRTGVRHRHGLLHRVALAPVRLLNTNTPPPVEEAKLEIPDERFRFTIEGDQNAVAYDAQTGVVSTDGSGTFVVEKAPGETTTANSEETPSNVHYKCDQDANCSLIMASVVVPHARMRTATPTSDWAFVSAPTDGPAHNAAQAPVLFGQVSR